MFSSNGMGDTRLSCNFFKTLSINQLYIAFEENLLACLKLRVFQGFVPHGQDYTSHQNLFQRHPIVFLRHPEPFLPTRPSSPRLVSLNQHSCSGILSRKCKSQKVIEIIPNLCPTMKISRNSAIRENI